MVDSSLSSAEKSVSNVRVMEAMLEYATFGVSSTRLEFDFPTPSVERKFALDEESGGCHP